VCVCVCVVPRYRVYCRKRDNLEQSFFLARRTFCEPLLHVQGNLTEIQTVPLLDLEKSHQQKPCVVDPSRRAMAWRGAACS
jgi:hypothetical protein